MRQLHEYSDMGRHRIALRPFPASAMMDVRTESARPREEALP